MIVDLFDLAAGAQNLLRHAAKLGAGEKLLIVHEAEHLGWYDDEAPHAIEREARALGILTTMVQVGPPGDPINANLADAIELHDCTVFFARIGDQDRFANPRSDKTIVMSYARTAAMLSSPFGRADYRAFEELRDAMNDILLTAGDIEITCPLGTKMTGSLNEAARSIRADVSVTRFPLGVPQPICAAELSGRVAIARYLTSTGSRVYHPPILSIDGEVYADIERGRIQSFSGDPASVRRVKGHYDHVASLFGIDGDVVHSWHAGIHAGCSYDIPAQDDPDRWSNTAFSNPRLLHFHTCGSTAPGEICWMVLDATVKVDGVALWEAGRLRLDNFERTRLCTNRWNDLATLSRCASDRLGLPV